MSPRLLLAVLALAVAFLLPATAHAKRPFVYVVVVDGLDGDKVEAGAAPFISSLLAGDAETAATYYPGSRSVMPAMTNPNHVAMMGGAFAEGSGIASNDFAIYAPLEHDESCVRTGPRNVRSLPTPTTGEHPSCPRSELVFEAVRRQAGMRHPTTAAIMGKPKLGFIFGGQNVRPDRLDADYLWAPCDSAPDDDSYCEDVPVNPITGYALTDEIVMDEVIATITTGVPRMGKMRRPKMTFVNLPQVDSAGHAFGAEAAAYDGAIALADDEVGRLVDALKSEGIWDRSVLVVASDHSMDTSPLKIAVSEVFDDAGIAAGSYLGIDTSGGSTELVYLADRRDPGRHELLKEMRNAIIAEPGVGTAHYRRPNPLDGGREHTRPNWRVAGARDGDLLVTAEPGFSFSDPDPSSNPVPGNHGAPQTRDGFLAVIGTPDLIRQREIAGDGRTKNPINVDVAPTVMRLLGLRPPGDSRGRLLRGALRANALVR